MKKVLFIIVVFFTATGCGNSGAPGNKEQTQPVIVERHSVPQDRPNPSPKPAAIFSEKVTGEMGNLNNWKFEVALYETSKTFTYRVQVKYAEMDITDTLQLPDFGLDPKPALQKGKDEYSCIIGFMDDKNAFRDYKLVKVTDGNINIHTLKYYGVRPYKVQ